MASRDSEALPSTLISESRGDRSNFKGTHYHLVYTLWALLRGDVSSVAFYQGNDLLAQPIRPPQETTEKLLLPLHAQQGGLDVWTQLKSTMDPWTLSKLLEENLLANYLYNALFSQSRGRACEILLITQGMVQRASVERFVRDREKFVYNAEIPPVSNSHDRKLRDIITSVQRGWQLEGYGVLDELQLYRIALKVLGDLALTEPVPLRAMEAEIKLQVAQVYPGERAIQQLPLTLLGALLQATSPESEAPREFTSEWLEQVAGIPLQIRALLDTDPSAACVKATQAALPRDWEANRCVRRPHLEEALQHFISSPKTLFVLLGLGGSGITWSMADWILRVLDGRMRLLVRGEDFHRQRELKTLVAACLREPTTAHLSDEQLLQKALAMRGEKTGSLILVIDGLVLRGDLEDIRHDVAKLVEDCRRLGVKLLLTCHKHGWDLHNPGAHVPLDDFFRLEPHVPSSNDVDQDSPQHRSSFLLPNLTRDELGEFLTRRLPTERAARAARLLSAPEFVPLRTPFLLDLYVKQHEAALGASRWAPIPVDIDRLLDRRVESCLGEAAGRIGCGVDDIRLGLDRLVEHLWERRPDGLSYKEAVDCLQAALPESISIYALQQVRHLGLLTPESPLRLAERAVEERLFAKFLGKKQQDENALREALQPEIDVDAGVVSAFLRGIAADPVRLTDQLLERDARWLSAVASGLAQGSPEEYGALALLTILARPKTRAIVGSEACTALGQLASRGERAWRWATQMYLSSRDMERYRGEAALATTMGIAPRRAGAAIRLRLSHLGRIERDRRDRSMKGALTPLLGINHREAAIVGERIIQQYGLPTSYGAQRPGQALLEAIDEVRGVIACFTDKIDDLLSQLYSQDRDERFRAACSLQPVVFERPDRVRADLFQAIRREGDAHVQSRLLQVSYRFCEIAPDGLLDTLEGSNVLRWEQAFHEASGMALALLGALASDKRRAERIYTLLPQRPDTFKPRAYAFFSELCAFAWWGCAEYVPEAGTYLSVLTQPDLASVEDKFRPFALRGAIVAQMALMCLSPREAGARSLLHVKRVKQYFWVDTDAFAKRYAKVLLAHPEYARLQELLLECLHEENRLGDNPLDPLRDAYYLCASTCLEVVVRLAILQTDPLPLLQLLPRDWQVLHAATTLLEAGRTEQAIVQWAQELCARYANGATMQAFDERERCLSQLARLKGDSHVALEEHQAQQWHLLLRLNGDARVLAELSSAHSDRTLSLLHRCVRSAEDLPTLYQWEEEATSWWGLLIARVYARMFDARPIGVKEARELCEQMLTAIRALPHSPERQEYESVYGTIARWLLDGRQPAPKLSEPESILRASHAYAVSLLQRACEEKSGESVSTWIADVFIDRRGWLETSQFGMDGDQIVSIFGRFMRCVLPAVRLACIAIGWQLHLGDPAARWLLERAQVDTFFREYSWTRDSELMAENRQLLEDAVAAFGGQCARTPRDERFLQRYGNLLLELGRVNEAEDILRRCVSLETWDQGVHASAFYDLARIYAKNRQEEKCHEALQDWARLSVPGLAAQQLVHERDFEAMREKLWFRAICGV